MDTALGWMDWTLVFLLALVLAVIGAAISLAASRSHTGREIDALQARLRVAEQQIQSLSRPKPDLPPARTEPLFVPRASPALEPVPTVADPPPPGVTMDGLTQAAALALGSLDAFRRFVAEAGGSGFVVTPGTQSCQSVGTPDPVSGADIWAVSFQGATLYFPGYNLLRSQSALLAGAGRPARDRLGWLYDIEAGDQLAALRPALQRPGEPIERGLLTLPF